MSRPPTRQRSKGTGDRPAELGALRRNEILSELGPEAFSDFLSLGRSKHFARNTLIFGKGDPGDCVFAIARGRIAIETVSEDGQIALLNLLGPGDLLGEIAAVDGNERTAGARALTAAHLLRIDRNDFMAFLERHPKAAVKVMILLCSRLRWTSAVIEDLTFLAVPQRLAKRLLGLGRQYGVDVGSGTKIAEPVSQESLAQMLGVTREFVNRCLGYLQDRRAIRYEQGHIVIVDRVLLEQLSG
jgi:CRP/FNR family transcriptional regulator, cyclic AMP receptor protein